MSDDPLDIDIDDLQRRMDGAMVSLKTEFASLRTGRASGKFGFQRDHGPVHATLQVININI